MSDYLQLYTPCGHCPACNQAQMADGSPLLPLQATQVGLVWHLRRKVVAARSGLSEDQFIDSDPWGEAVQPSSSSGDTGQQGQARTDGSNPHAINGIPEGEGPQNVHIGGCSGRIRAAAANERGGEQMDSCYVTIMGALPDSAEEPTSSQLAALSRRTLVHDCAPYVDFSVWTPFARKTIKTQKYRQCFRWETGHT